MKTKPLLAAVLLTLSPTPKNQAYASGPPINLVKPFSKGVCTGAFYATCKQIAAALRDAVEQRPGAHHIQPETNDLTGRTVRNFKLSFSAHALATAYVGKRFAMSQAEIMKCISQLPLSIAGMEFVRASLDDAPVNHATKEAASLGAFFLGAVAQGRPPKPTAWGIVGFVGGMHMMTSQKKTDACNSALSGTLRSLATTGFLAPGTNQAAGRVAAAGPTDYLREQFGLKEDSEVWPAPDGSAFVSISGPKDKNVNPAPSLL